MRRSLLLLLVLLAGCSQDSGPPVNPPPGGGGGDLSISGTVSAPAGESVAGTTVAACFARDCNDSRSLGVTVTQGGGSASFQLGGLAAGSYSVVAVKDVNQNDALDAGDLVSSAVEVTPPATGVTLTMQVRGGGGGDGGDGGGGGGGTGACAVELSGDLTVSSRFVNSPSECDYLVMGFVSVENGQFTIEPGTVFRFAQDAILRVGDNAGLDAVGTAAAPIRFEAAAPVKGYGKGLNISPDSLVTRLEHVQFLNLGKDDTGPFGGLQDGAIDGLGGGGLIMKNVTVSGSVYDGATLRNLPLLEFENNTFTDNARYPVRVFADQVKLLDAGSDYLGVGAPNGRPYVDVDGVVTDGVSESATWQKLNAPYYVSIALYINNGTLTLEPGVVFVFGDDAGVLVQDTGALKAVGTPQAPILFTGEQNAQGYWEGISYFESGSRDNVLEYAEVRNGGSGSYGDGAVTLISAFEQSYARVGNSVITGSATWGICADDGSTLDLGPGNTFRDNAYGDVNETCD